MDAPTFYLAATVAQIVLPFLLCLLLLPLERNLPRRPAASSFRQRWQINIPLGLAGVTLGVLGSYYLSTRIGSLGASFAVMSLAAIAIPPSVKFLSGLMIIDLMAYGLHVLAHKLGVLWRLHQIHHSDNEFDASTGLRHQPLEGLVNMCVLTFGFGLIGMPFAIIASYGVLAAMHAILSHANVAIPPRVDRVLRLLIVTPDMHRLHHSADRAEYDSNYGQVFPYWDWLFRTLRAKPVTEQAKMPLGLGKVADSRNLTALQLTLLPFGPYALSQGNSGESRKRGSARAETSRASRARQTGRPEKAKRKR